MHNRLRRSIIALALCLFLLMLPLGGIMAQEGGAEGAAAETASVPGVGTFVFFIGAGAILLVGVAMIARDRFKEESDGSK